MDLVLRVSDDLFLDRVWAKLVPLSAFTALPGSFQHINGSVGTWSQAISFLPHPPENLSAYYSSSHPLSAWPRDYLPRQLLSLVLITLIGIHILYFLFAGLSYEFIFNHEMMKHPRFLKNQVKLEIQTSLRSFPGMTLLTLPWFQAEVMGYSKLYDGLDTYGYVYLFASVPLFLIFTDYCIYWIHRWLHVPFLYKIIHKPHHKWIVPTPFASHAFHPLDGYLQSVPYHLFIFIFPLHRVLYLVLFVLVNFWSIFVSQIDEFLMVLTSF
ncbi:hypothetical protein AX15_004136 [Amanita polypyramis BW_CC]|nr:hypothetical protein AX15_004136 [Amanita polypyramis BW_CC]